MVAIFIATVLGGNGVLGWKSNASPRIARPCAHGHVTHQHAIKNVVQFAISLRVQLAARVSTLTVAK